MRSSLFHAEIRELYGRENGIQPFIGDTFASGEPSALRVMTIGINAYLSEDDWSRQNPEWFSGWFREGRHRFDRTVAADAATVANALVAEPSPFAGLTYRGKESIFHTNAVKVYMPESSGKRSDQVERRDYERCVPTWHAELDTMAKHGVLPHVILVFGRPFWEWAWQAFHPTTRPRFAHLEVHELRSAPGPGHHFANRGEIEGAGGRHTFALLGLRHPAARATSKASPEWLLSLPALRALLGLARL